MQLRLAGLFQRESSAVAIGVALCGATLAVLGVAAGLANNDRLAETRAKRTDDVAEQPEKVAVGSLPDGATTTQVQGTEEGKKGQDEENRATEPDVAGPPTAPSASWEAGIMLCGELLPAEDSGSMNDDAATLARRVEELATALVQKDEELRVARALLAGSSNGGGGGARTTAPGGYEGGERHAARWPWW